LHGAFCGQAVFFSSSSSSSLKAWPVQNLIAALAAHGFLNFQRLHLFKDNYFERC